MELDDVERNWETFGRTDPLWAILTHADRKDNRWNIDDFFRTGEQWIAHLKEEIEASGVTLSSGRSLDFGCGVGRLTQALCKHFERCDGVDIADSMISLARRYNRYGERCKYHVNKSDNLGLFADDTFDFVYSLIVLQHLEPRFGKRYIAEFVRVLKPGGVAAFQIPSAYLGVRNHDAPSERPEFVESAPLTHKYRASITSPIRKLVIQPRQRLTVKVIVCNKSNIIWALSVGNPLRLGNHWLNLDGSIVQLDDGRTDLPRPISPDEEVALPLTVTAPASPGRYLLEIDLVEEHIAWFGQRGVVPLRLPVTNRLPRTFVRLLRGLGSKVVRSRKAGVAIEPEPLMEMHCIPPAEVIEVVARAGAQVIRIFNEGAGGPDYESCHYVVSKPR